MDISDNNLPERVTSEIIARIRDVSGEPGVHTFVGTIKTGDRNRFTEEHRRALETKGWTVIATVFSDDILAQSARVMPTETTDLVYIDGAQPAEVIHVYGLSGVRVLSSETDASGHAELSLAGKPAGVCIVTVGSLRQSILLR